MLDFVLVIWLVKGGLIEQPVERRHCVEALSLYQSSLATGRPLLHAAQNGESHVVLDVRCEQRASVPIS